MTAALAADSQESLFSGACAGLVSADASITKAADGRRTGQLAKVEHQPSQGAIYAHGLTKTEYDKSYKAFINQGRGTQDMTAEQIKEFGQKVGRKKLFKIWLDSGKSFAQATLSEKAFQRNASGGRSVC